jgi:hypothetical protein
MSRPSSIFWAICQTSRIGRLERGADGLVRIAVRVVQRPIGEDADVVEALAVAKVDEGIFRLLSGVIELAFP